MSKAVILAVVVAVLSRPAAASPDTHRQIRRIRAQTQTRELPPCKIPGDARCAVDPSSLVVRMEEDGAALDAVDPPAAGDPGGVDIGSIVNIFKTVWDLIKENRPSVDIKTDFAAALPQGITSWNQLAGWKAPEGKVYGFYAKNKFGQRIVNVRYLIQRMYGGGYKGKGKYLAGVTAYPLTVEVGLGYTLKLSADAPAVIQNIGTDEDPVAGMSFKVTWNIKTVMKDATGTSVYWLDGNGAFREDGSPFPHGLTQAAARVLAPAATLRLP